MLRLGLADYSSSELVRGVAQVGLGVGLSAAVYALQGFHGRSLFSYFFRRPGPNGWDLGFAPTEVGWADRVFLLVGGVLNKALRGLFGARLNARGERVELPRLDIRCPVEVTRTHEQLYRSAVDGSRGGDEFLLAALTNQLMLLLVVHPRLPVSPMGAVNVRNRIEFHQPTPRGERLNAHAHVGGKDNPGRTTRRGIELDIHIDVHHASTQHLILRQTLTILAPSKTPLPPQPQPHPSTNHPVQDEKEEEGFERVASIEMPSSAPWAWSAVCGDYNPIHVSSTLARLFGFPGKLAHGNHVVAKVLHLLPSSSEGGWWIEMQFKRPMVLPLRLSAEVDGQGKRWRCTGVGGKVYVQGEIGCL